MNAPYKRLPSIVFIFFIVANAVMLWTANLLPFQDLPNHLAEATIFRYNRNTGDFMNYFYAAVPAYYPNTFYPVFCSLFPSVETGNRIFYILSTTMLLSSMFLIIKELRGNIWYGLLSLLFVYNYNVTFGFSGFTISIPTLLFLFYVLLLDARNDRFRNKIIASVLLVLLYLMHAQVALFGLLLYGLMMLYRFWGRFKVLFIRIVFIPLPVILLVFYWWFTRAGEKEESTLPYLLQYYSGEFFTTFPMRFRLALFDNFQLREGITGLALAAIFFSLLFIPLFYYNPWKHFRSEQRWRSKEFVYPLILLVTALGCYGFLPNKLPGQSPLYERFSTVVNLSIIILGSVLLKDIRSKSLQVFVCVAAFIYHGLWFEYIIAFNQVNKSFNASFFKDLGPKDRLGGLIYNNKFRGRMLYLHFPSYYVVWNKGLATSMVIDYRFGVVRRAESGEQIPFYNEWIGEVYKEEPAYKDNLEWLLVRGRAQKQPDPNMAGFYLYKKTGDWELFKNKRQIPPVHVDH